MKIPITFTFNDKIFTGIFLQVSGTGSTTNFHLYIDQFYYGILVYRKEWEFLSPKDNFEGMSEYFGAYIIAWVDGLQ